MTHINLALVIKKMQIKTILQGDFISFKLQKLRSVMTIPSVR